MQFAINDDTDLTWVADAITLEDVYEHFGINPVIRTVLRIGLAVVIVVAAGVTTVLIIRKKKKKAEKEAKKAEKAEKPKRRRRASKPKNAETSAEPGQQSDSEAISA